MKITIVLITALCLGVTFGQNNVDALIPEDVEAFKTLHSNDTAVLFFHNSQNKGETGFFRSIFGLFGNSNKDLDEEYQTLLAKKYPTMEIDTKIDYLKPVAENYQVDKMPYIIAFHKNREIWREMPSKDTPNIIENLIKEEESKGIQYNYENTVKVETPTVVEASSQVTPVSSNVTTESSLSSSGVITESSSNGTISELIINETVSAIPSNATVEVSPPNATVEISPPNGTISLSPINNTISIPSPNTTYWSNSSSWGNATSWSSSSSWGSQSQPIQYTSYNKSKEEIQEFVDPFDESIHYKVNTSEFEDEDVNPTYRKKYGSYSSSSSRGSYSANPYLQTTLGPVSTSSSYYGSSRGYPTSSSYSSSGYSGQYSSSYPSSYNSSYMQSASYSTIPQSSYYTNSNQYVPTSGYSSGYASSGYGYPQSSGYSTYTTGGYASPSSGSYVYNQTTGTQPGYTITNGQSYYTSGGYVAPTNQSYTTYNQSYYTSGGYAQPMSYNYNPSVSSSDWSQYTYPQVDFPTSTDWDPATYPTNYQPLPETSVIASQLNSAASSVNNATLNGTVSYKAESSLTEVIPGITVRHFDEDNY